MTDTAFQSANALVQALRSRTISAGDLLELYLERIDRYNPAVNALVHIDRDAARATAREADAALARGENIGPLSGLPMTVKESYDVAGWPTTRGNPALKDTIAPRDSVVAARLKAAGANIFGKTNVPINLSDLQSYNAVYGTTNNPWNLERTPGGSSGGSAAALAAGLTGLEVGSDIGGSIRNPAHFSGVYGHKTTWGIVPQRGHAAPDILASSDISVMGPLGRSAEDLALELDVIAGPDDLDAAGWRLDLPAPTKTRLGDYRVAAWLDDPLSPVGSEVGTAQQAVIDCLAKLGVAVDDKARPDFDAAHANAVYWNLLQSVTHARLPREDFDRDCARAAELDPNDQGHSARVLRAGVQRHRDWLAMNEARTHLRWRWHEFFEEYDVLLSPIAAVPAFPQDESADMGKRHLTVDNVEQPYFQHIFWAGMTGVVFLPSTVAPIGRSPSGLPIGIQIIGPAMHDRITIDFARLLANEIGGFQPPPGYD